MWCTTVCHCGSTEGDSRLVLGTQKDREFPLVSAVRPGPIADGLTLASWGAICRKLSGVCVTPRLVRRVHEVHTCAVQVVDVG